ncbi:putative beta-propeller-type glycoside hydrolase [Limnoglobus roseus]|uniref:Putative beta-propeller-type glycoside hydrolase n=2 Tax=Limnoglobus roseus TaxID=2598579 RepID=A0A5C1A4P4_9BACT|nr:putative beta-propeller-type glycoside hydrolase [Limnoglobus roseus]
MSRFRLLFLALFLALPATLVALTPPEDAAPKLPDGKDAATKQMAAFRLPAGMKVELYAAEPMLASPVAISLDEKNRVYVSEEHRFSRGTEENRTRSFFLEDDLQIRTLDDRLKMYQKWEKKFDGGMNWFTKYADQVRLLEDTTGSGRADKSTVLAQFREPLDGLAAGILAVNGDVYVTCIPDLRVIKKGTDKPVSLLHGFGVNCAFLGHDLHGLIFGPDGKLYFSVGDRGFDVTSKEGTHFSGPRTGAVFRCNADGTELEVVHRGLRNPQELAFDQYGNLFADDNNCDKGDHARLVYVVEDGESGWNMAYQTIEPHTNAPWFAERLWHLQNAGQPAYIVPPVGKIGTGPSGFLFTSGTSLPDRYKNSFIMCNYAGSIGGLEAFRVKPTGAGFEIEDYHDFLKPIMATDATFGYDGKLYVSDFVNLDWSGKSLGGRIYTAFDPKKLESDVVQETKKLFEEGFEKLGYKKLGELLGHADQRVRLRAQHELMKRLGQADEEGKVIAWMVFKMATEKGDQLARIHAIWTSRTLWKMSTKAHNNYRRLLADPDPEIRAQYANVLGDARLIGNPDQEESNAPADLLKLLTDSNARVKFFAAQSLGKLKAKAAVGPLFEVLRQNKDTDVYLRHACVAALAKIGDADAVAAKTKDESAAVRLAVVLVQRRLKDSRIAAALTDADWFIRAEAARAIHDLPLEDVYPQLAAVLPALGEKPIPDGDPLVRRCIDAAYRLGGVDHAKAVLGVVTNANFSAVVRAEALSALAQWADPLPRDRVTGFWRPLSKRDPAEVRALLEANLSELLSKTSGSLQTAAIGAIQKLGVKADPAQFVAWATDAAKDANFRVAAMRFLASQKAAKLDAILTASLKDSSPIIRSEARELIAKADANRGTSLLADVLDDDNATKVESQRALALLPALKTPEAGQLLDRAAEQLAAGEIPPALRLDVLDAVKAWPSPARDKARAKFEAGLPADEVGKFRVSLHGGDADRGREVFFNHAAAQCVRCHTVSGSGGTAGPELTKVAGKYKGTAREHFLESLLVPSAKIADGFASVTLTLLDGRVLAGTILKEDKKTIVLQDTNGKPVTVPVEDVESRTKPTSPMPAVGQTLTRREVRDLIEYLTTLK